MRRPRFGMTLTPVHDSMRGRGLLHGTPGLAAFRGFLRSVRLAARTLAFQAGNGGSIPPRTIGGGTPTRSSTAEQAAYNGQVEGSNPSGSRSNEAQVLVAAHLALTQDVRVRVPRASLLGNCTHDVAAAYCLAMADVWVRLPLGALLRSRGDPVVPDGPLTPLWCSGSTPLCHGGGTGSIPVEGAK